MTIISITKKLDQEIDGAFSFIVLLINKNKHFTLELLNSINKNEKISNAALNLKKQKIRLSFFNNNITLTLLRRKIIEVTLQHRKISKS